MRAMKDSGIPWIEEIPENWSVFNIRQLFSFGKGLPITKENLREKGVSVISYGQIHSKLNKGTSIIPDLIRYVDNSYLTSNPESLTKKGDFIFADTSEDVLGCGNCVYVDKDITLFAGYHTIILRNKAKESSKYLAYLFSTDAWRKQIRERVAGVKLFSVSQKILRETSIILPPFVEQERIVDCLDTECARIDAVMEQTRASIEEYKKLKQSIVTEAVTKGIRPNRRVKPCTIDNLDVIPESWKEIRNSFLFRENVRIPYEDSPSLSLSQADGLILTDDMKERSLKTSSYDGWKRVEKGDLVLNRFKAHLGVFFAASVEGMVSFHYGVYAPVQIINSKYYEYLFHSDIYRGIFSYKSNGMTVGLQNLSNQSFYDVKSLYPPIEEQNEIVAWLDQENSRIDSLIEKKQELLSGLESYKQSIIFERIGIVTL